MGLGVYFIAGEIKRGVIIFKRLYGKLGVRFELNFSYCFVFKYRMGVGLGLRVWVCERGVWFFIIVLCDLGLLLFVFEWDFII